ncbi:CheR family methyltransferase, partial [Elusimicrobiota bacterium]
MNLELKDNEFKLFQELILEKSGLNFDDSKRKSLKVSLLSRIRYKGFDNYQQYYKYINFHPDGRTEFRDLITLLTINETMFFRNPDQFKILKNNVLPEIINENKDKNIKIWSAGCSTGEEPYSIAICMRELVGFANKWNIEILGVDIDKKALASAKEGIYKTRALRITDKTYIDRYFNENEIDGKYKIKQEIRDMVSFDYFNLAEVPYPVALNGKWDIIFCRNVLIYFNTDLIEKIIERFYEGIKDGGYLFIGYSEILSAYKNSFSPAKFDGVYIYKKDGLGK